MENLIIGVPLLGGVFALCVKYGRRFANLIVRLPIPKIILALLVAVPLITIEEHISCGAYGCTNVIFPPTLLFLLIMELAYFGVIKLIRLKKVINQIWAFTVFGMFFEFVFGVASKELQKLIISQPIIFLIVIVWVGFSYAFIIYLPLLILSAQKIPADIKIVSEAPKI